MKLIITDMKELENGDWSVTFDYDKDFIDFVRKYYKVKRLSKKRIKEFILEGLENYIKKQEEK